MVGQVYLQHTEEELVFSLFRQKWTIALLRELASSRRFSVLQRSLGISSKTLSARLQALVAQGLITKAIYAEVPVRVEYELTVKGRELLTIIQGIDAWEKKWL